MSLTRARLGYHVVAFGFWRMERAHETGLPWPVADSAPDPAFLDRVAQIQSRLVQNQLDGGLLTYSGATHSRLTGQALGTREFYTCDDAQKIRFAWPEDYASHYLAAGVAPDPEFVTLIEQLHARVRTPS